MSDKRLEQGIKNLKKIDGEAGERVIENLEAIAPDVGRYILEFAFGDIYNNDRLSFREREIITITSLLTPWFVERGNYGRRDYRDFYPLHSLCGISASFECNHKR